MSNKFIDGNISIRVYHGYGHTNNLILFGHVLKNRPTVRARYSNNIAANILHLFRMFMVTPVNDKMVTLKWNNQVLEAITEKDGFFKFEWQSESSVPAGWHSVSVELKGTDHNSAHVGEGKILVPHSTQFGFISDIDDTVLVSHAATIVKRLKVLFTKNPHTREAFSDVVAHYNLLAGAGTTSEVPNPFFYVSSSEWNLYDYLDDFFKFNKFPEGIFLLNQIKKITQLLRTGKTEHGGKLLRVVRILEAFPEQQFVLLGDSSQKDPEIYETVVQKYPGKIFAVYIRNIRPSKETPTRNLLNTLSKQGIHTCLFSHNIEAINHSKKIGLI